LRGAAGLPRLETLKTSDAFCIPSAMNQLIRNVNHALVLGVSLLAMACGGSSSDNNPTGPSGAASSGFTFAADAGTRISGSNASEPNVLAIADGTLMFLSFNGGLGPNALYNSSDGLTFAPRAASQVPVNFRSHSFVRLPNGTYRMYFMGITGADLLSATSPDGLNWTQEAGVRITLNSIAVPFVAAMGGGYRVFYVQSGGPTPIASAFSSDGLTFSPEGIRIPTTSTLMWADPSVVSLDSGGYLMTLSDAFSSANASGFARLWLATSPDGLSWTVDTQPIVTDSTHSLIDPTAAVSLGGGRYRIYYASASGPVQSLGTTTIVSGVISR
jgi:uncharacterized protein YodC (DUF2158 family)